MVHKYIDSLFDMDKRIIKIVKIGFIFSIILCFIATTIFYFYHINALTYIYHDISLILFQTGIIFAIGFFVCGFATNRIMMNY